MGEVSLAGRMWNVIFLLEYLRGDKITAGNFERASFESQIKTIRSRGWWKNHSICILLDAFEFGYLRLYESVLVSIPACGTVFTSVQLFFLLIYWIHLVCFLLKVWWIWRKNAPRSFKIRCFCEMDFLVISYFQGRNWMFFFST